MSKRSVYSTISPLPVGLSREVVLDFLHNHTEMIDLNPLVIERHFINPPKNVDFEERNCVWYSMTDKIDYLPGGKVSGDISYTCCFHDLKNGIQTHCRAPLGVDIRNKWTLNGSLPGEPPEAVELGMNVPASGLYLREDTDLRCNILMSSFVKKNLKKSHATLVNALVERARHVETAASNGAGAGESTSTLRVDKTLPLAWSPPKHAPVQLRDTHQRRNSDISTASSTSQINNAMPVLDPAIRYSHTSSYNVPQPYRAPSQHSSQAQIQTTTPVLRMPSQHSFVAKPYSVHPSALRVPAPSPPQQQQEFSRSSLPYPDTPYPEDSDFLMEPLRIVGGTRSRATSDASPPSLTPSSWSSRGSSEHEHPMYPHLNPYSASTDRSSSPDEPRTPEALKPHVARKGYLNELDHPEVLRPGSGRLSASLRGPFIAELE